MNKTILGGLSLLMALLMGGFAYHLLVGCIFPWLKAPETTHFTLITAGIQWAGWQLFVPFSISMILAAGFAWWGVEKISAKS